MSNRRRPLASLRKQHRKGKRAISQRDAHRANLRRESREERYGVKTG